MTVYLNIIYNIYIEYRLYLYKYNVSRYIVDCKRAYLYEKINKNEFSTKKKF